MNPYELLREAREVLGRYWFTSTDEESYNNDDVIEISKAIDAALAEHEEQEPVAWMGPNGLPYCAAEKKQRLAEEGPYCEFTPLYTAPPAPSEDARKYSPSKLLHLLKYYTEAELVARFKEEAAMQKGSHDR